MDCIAAISTPAASGGVSMIRISGEDAFEVAKKVFKPKFPQTDIDKMNGYTASYGDILKDGKKIDDGILLIFRAPHSYTGENVVEITCHGGIYITKLVLKCCLSAGARMAQAG
ncbi:MAG: tRNA uridine-5-carboxymethylaminomethyl(34) synthesis GTPase MnmE, partial [Ruminiclostridium sp.]|nr:tRNA uridine-5-carboxymethylaminomethyl(34) synthesis GTPase MnmE [Ruminiclostridium sp.]